MLAAIPKSLSTLRVGGFSIARRASMSTSTVLPQSPIPIFTTLAQLREWRSKAFSEDKSVGFVPTMGALHEGHLSLVRHSLAENDLTVVSIFVNPTQFAPHEDLASYPRTLPQDLDALTSLRVPSQRTPSAVFLPSVDVMYPSSSRQSPPSQTGTFVEVNGLGAVMEGAARPGFFRGVATVVTKLFNAVQPSHAYFGQKDIQQALLLRRMVADLLLAHPTPQTLHVVPTARSPHPADAGLALSSRNAYLTPEERVYAPVLYRSLKTAEGAWAEGASKRDVVEVAMDLLEAEARTAKDSAVEMRTDYVEINDPWTFDIVRDHESKDSSEENRALILSGAVWVGKTRLIDNILLGDSSKILY
ncbi:Pantoate-beta-alanine ligase [Phellopilus nigrolimitatus]|nr:Pantoate-beta-alanine ligase [Phellopilus nigrolimitatus]